MQKKDENKETYKDSKKLYDTLKQKFKNSFDIKVEIIQTVKEPVVISYVEGFINRDLLGRDILTPLKNPSFEGDIIKAINASIKSEDSIDNLTAEVLKGELALCYDGLFYLIDIRKWDKRSVEPPEAENVIVGPKEGFTEDLITNTSLLRRKIRNASFVMENISLGRQTNTTVVLAYIDDIVNLEVLDKVKEKLKEIDIDAVFDSGKMEQLIEQKPFSTISGIGMTQKPDITAMKILDGRVAILCDGTPHALTIPELFIENIYTGEDYYHKVLFASFLRVLRSIGLFISILLPGLSVAIMNYNPAGIPSSFLINLVSSTQGTPFPEAIEIFFLILMLELLKESGTRLPKSIGSAVSIVGALIIGEAAVSAGIVSAPTVIIVALTAVCSFIVPNLNGFTTIHRLVFLVLGATFGVIGIGAGVIFMLAQLTSINSFGVPIMSFFYKENLKDSWIRFPIRSLKYRPKSISKRNVKKVA